MTVEQLYDSCLTKLTVKPHTGYQPDGIKWMLNKELNGNGGGILADEVGLGKTLQAIALVCGNSVHKTLILVPKSLVDQWCNEFQKFAPSVNVIKMENLKNDKMTFDGDTNVVIAPISQVYGRDHKKNVINQCDYKKTDFHRIEWGRLIIDEAHAIKNKKSKMHKACFDIETEYKWLLTATPVMNKMKEFVNLMSFFGYGKNECQTKKLEIVEEMILRRTKEDVKEFDEKLNLPELDITIKEIPFETKHEELLYQEVFFKMKKEMKNVPVGDQNMMKALERLLRIRQLCVHPQLYYDGIAKKTKTEPEEYTGNCTKLNTLMRMLKEKPADEKGLVFCQFIKEMEFYKKKITEMGMKCMVIDGSMELYERTKVINKFKQESDLNILLIQINTGGTGYNLQEANWVYIMSPTWNPCLEHQAIGRAHRTGQKKKVNVFKLIIKGESEEYTYIEDKIIELQNKKKVIIAEILNDKRIADECVKMVRVDKAATGISIRDINGLFR